MKVFVAGATGVVGRRAVKLLSRAGNQVTAVARNPESARLVEELGATAVGVDLFDPESVRGAVVGQEAVINLATKIPPLLLAALPGAWRENNRIRSVASRNLVDGALAEGAGRYLQESFAPIYPDRGAGWIDEGAQVAPAQYVQSVLEAEHQTERFTAAGGIGVILRFGLFYGPDGSHMETTLRLARFGISTVVGPPETYMSSITTDDAATAVVAALGAPAGTYNVVDNEPVTRRQYIDAFAQALRLPRLRILPAWLAGLGGSKARMLMRSQRVSNLRLREATSWSPAYPSAIEGWHKVVAQLPDAASRSGPVNRR
ncbi:MAG: NAD-dependent epimerase/dehydratase family protein [Acidimicrobiia bacterium]